MVRESLCELGLKYVVEQRNCRSRVDVKQAFVLRAEIVLFVVSQCVNGPQGAGGLLRQPKVLERF